jgi:phage terminase Nu1 subunit (DNA packaging protein)
MEQVSRERLHDLTGQSFRTVTRRLQAAGIEPIAREGRSDLYDSTVALPALLRDPDAAEGPDLSRERALLARAQREKLEREAQIAAGQLLDAAVVVQGWQRLCYAVRQHLLALPQALAPQVAAEDDAVACHKLLDDAVYDALSALAEAKA